MNANSDTSTKMNALRPAPSPTPSVSCCLAGESSPGGGCASFTAAVSSETVASGEEAAITGGSVANDCVEEVVVAGVFVVSVSVEDVVEITVGEALSTLSVDGRLPSGRI